LSKTKDDAPRPLPSREEILAFIARERAAAAQAGLPAPAKIGKREIARAFDVKGQAERMLLKKMLKELEGEGAVERRGKTLHRPGMLPPVVLADVTGRDSDGDLVATPAEWDEEHGPTPRIALFIPRKQRPGAPTPGVGDRALVRVELNRDADARAPAYTGRVIKLLSRARTQTLGVFRADPNGGGRVLPVDKKQANRGELQVPAGAEGEARDGDLVAVETLRAGRYGLPQARVRERLGSMASEKAVSLIAIHTHGIPHVFRPETIREAEAARPATLAGREDWREPCRSSPSIRRMRKTTTTRCTPRPTTIRQRRRLRAHRRHRRCRRLCAARRRARPRGSGSRQFGLFPRPRRADAARAHLQRSVFAAPAGGSPGARRAHDHRRARPQAAAHVPPRHDALGGEAVLPAGAGRARRVRRRNDGAAARSCPEAAARGARGPEDRAQARSPLELDLPERKILLKPDGTVDRVVIPPRLDTHRLIEEFMVLANVAAAETLEGERQPLIYRTHDEPSIEKMNALAEFLASLDIRIAKGQVLKPQQFNGILERVRDSENEHLVNEVVLRAQAQAEYTPDNYGHFGLHLQRYAHFTSPIRRYADLIVHRALIRALGLGKDGLPDGDMGELAEIAARISAAERRAMAAERETIDRLIATHLADRIGATFAGRIAGVTKSGLFVKLSETGADGFIPAATLGQDYFHYDEGQHALIAGRSGESFRLGDMVDVRLVEAAPFAGALRFEMLSKGKTRATALGKGGKTRKGARRVTFPKGKGGARKTRR
jgi:ribonuclease R